MSIVGKVDSLWRYPVKSMRGEELEEAFARLSRSLRRPRLRLQKFGKPDGVSVFHGARAAETSAISTPVSLS